MTNTQISLTDFRKDIFKLTDEVQQPSKYFVLTDKGKSKAVVMSYEEFESWIETLEVVEMFPDLKEVMKETEADMKSGKYKEYTTLEELLAQHGFVHEASNNKYEVSNTSKTKSNKRNRKNS